VPALSKWVDTRDSHPTAIFCKLLPSVVYHSDYLKATIRRVPGYAFSGIPLLNNSALLRDLKALVTLDPSPQVLTAIGIPPHVHHAKLTKSCLELCQSALTEVKKISSDVQQAVCDAIEAKAFENGIVTTQTLTEMLLDVHHKQMETLITTRLAALQTAIPTPAGVLAVNQHQGPDDDFELAHGLDDNKPGPTPTCIAYCSYSHSGRFWHTPQHFSLPPRMKLDTGWKLWCSGIKWK
jgi:hypothetical protein